MSSSYHRLVIPTWAFVAVTLPLVLTPGASTAIVLRNSIAGGIRGGLLTAAGANTGSFCYGLLTAFGFSIALQRWPSVWTILRVAGVVYLAWLGVQSLGRAISTRAAATAAAAGPPQSTWRNVYQGFVTNALNPSLATFYLVLVPQFIPRGAPIARTALILTAIHISLAVSWHIAWAVAGGTLARALSAGRPRQILEATSGIALLALSVKIATR
jgi:threonine/homoserine/homoserine lactone efflux protein